MNEFKHALRHLVEHRDKALALFWFPFSAFALAGTGLAFVALGVGRSVVAPRVWSSDIATTASWTALFTAHWGWWCLLLASVAVVAATALWAHRRCLSTIAQLLPPAVAQRDAQRSWPSRTKLVVGLVLSAILLGSVILVAGLPLWVLLASFATEAQSLHQGGEISTPLWVYLGWACSSFAFVAVLQLVVFYLRLVFQFSKL